MKIFMIIKATKELEDGSVGLIGVPQDIAFPGDNYILLDNQDSKKGKQFAVDDIWKFQLLDGTPGEYLSITRPGEKVMLITDSLGIEEVHIGDKIIYMGITANSPSKISSDKPTKKGKKPWYKKWWIWTIICLVVLIALLSSTGNKSALSVNDLDSLSNTNVSGESVGNYGLYGETTISKKEFQKIPYSEIKKFAQDSLAQYDYIIIKFDDGTGLEINNTEFFSYGIIKKRSNKNLSTSEDTIDILAEAFDKGTYYVLVDTSFKPITNSKQTNGINGITLSNSKIEELSPMD